MLQQNNLKPFSVNHPDWIKNATIYEVHIRQFTKSGTIREMMSHLPRLKDLGVDVLWLMPVQPIGIKNRKGQMGSPYAIRDFVSVNPELGNLDDLKLFIENAHKLGMYVILDWVAKHTAWDHYWIEQHPGFYNKDWQGNIIHPANTDWFDVADLNFDNPALRKEMIESLKYWIESVDIDGFRCDMAGLVPVHFWNEARIELDAIKPVFMLAEAEQIEMHFQAFDMTYNWACHHLMNEIACGQKSVFDLDEWLFRDALNYPKNAIRLNFTSNHDENKNTGSAIERMGDSLKAFQVLSFTMPGSPLIFSGQEAGLNRKLLFFDKDEIDWSLTKEYTPFLKSLVKLKKENKALWSGVAGGMMQRLYTDKNDKVFAYRRVDTMNQVVVVINLSNENHTFFLDVDINNNQYFSFFSNENLCSNSIQLIAWGFDVFIAKN